MKLFSILIRHCSPKDKKESLVGYFLAEDETMLYNYIDKNLMSGIWTDRHNDSLTEPITTEIYDDNYNVINSYTESYKELMLRVRGEFNDPNADYDEAYYGITHYGWSEGKEITEQQANTLIELGIAKSLS